MGMTNERSVPRHTRAIAATAPGRPGASTSFVEIERTLDPLGAHDLLVEVRAVAVNPVDIKLLEVPGDQGPRVVGYDASGVVVATGHSASRFSPGDEVYYAGSITRSGANAEFHTVDERLVGHKPSSLDFAAAAALPLTSITAWESLFIHLGMHATTVGAFLVVGAAGGVGSMVTQLARHCTKTTILATASRPESRSWVEAMGAHAIVDRGHLLEDVRHLAPRGLPWIFSAFSGGMERTYSELLDIGGTVVAIDDPEGIDIRSLKDKSQAWRWEAMFSRPRFDPESGLHGKILNEVAALADAGAITSTATIRLQGLTPANLRRAHLGIAEAGSIGKTVIELH